MAYTSEIEKLERRWKENPLGTAFAPLAEVYRKDGQLERARETLKQGLANNPNYIPGNIVLGRCCLDMKEDNGAEAAFSHVIELDAENVIALKALGDIAERQSRFDEATRWLNRLAQVDPSNEEARDQLKRIAATRESTAMMMAAQPEAAEVPDTSALEAEAIEPSITEVSSGEIHTGEILVEGPEGLEAEPVRGTVVPEAEPLMTIERQGVTDTASLLLGEDEDTLVVEAVTSAASSPPAFEESDLTPPASEEPLIEPSPYEPVSFSDYPTSRGSGADLGVEVFPVHAEEPAAIELQPSGHSEFQAPDDAGEMLTMRGGSSEFQEPDAAGELSLSAPVGGNEFQPPSGSEELLTATGSGSEFQDISDPTRDLGSSASLETERLAGAPTEEMSFGAEPVAAVPVPLPQGGLTLIFPEDAGRAEPPRTRRLSDPEEVPVEPVQSEPEPVLTESMAEMYARQGLANEALHVYRQLAKRAPEDARLAERIDALETAAVETPGSRRPPFAASVTGGESVESFFSSLVASRPAAPGTGGGSAAPIRADEAEDDDKPGAPTRPASDPLSLSAIFGEEATAPPATPPPQASASTPTTGHAFSFDQFFGAKDSAGGGQSAPSTRTSKPSGLEEDLDQFQHWLKSLKK